MKSYSNYKDSGVKWLGQIPLHWEEKKLRYFLESFSEKNHPSEQLLSVVREQGIIVRDITSKDENHNYIPEDLSGYKLIDKGDFAINKMKAWQGSYSISQHRGIVSPAYYTCHFRNADKEFFNIAIRSKAYVPFFTQFSKGIRVGQWDLPLVAMKNIPLFLPPLSEQLSIVSYLDGKVSAMDRLVLLTQQKVEHLKALKQAIIQEAVTTGIPNKNHVLKQTNIKWIKQIPQHWEEKRAKNMFVRMARPVREEDEVITCFRDGEVTLRKNRRTEGFTESFKEIGYQGIRKGDLVIHQMDAFAGSIGVSDSDGKGTPVYICLQPKIECNNVYYAHLLRVMAYSGYIKSLYRGIRERSSDFRYETFARLYLPLPLSRSKKKLLPISMRKPQK